MGHDKIHAASHETGGSDEIPELAALAAIADIQEYHTVSAGEVTAGFFTLAQTPADAAGVVVMSVSGSIQVSKKGTNLGALTPDFDVLNSNELHFNNNGAATGLSGNIIADDVLAIIYRY